ncbi:uncharacterized protein LOC132547119 [Ylistrum balloti]|uniref:uncharacterized protein LOC132547119 n=1 Tax=Ylistrum balloti TaxID=509963 RepID=UPI0029059642|nr:uncharacterized protein LOC132547119 [Ylistrum balloti]
MEYGDFGLAVSLVMTSVSQKAHLIHDSGGYFDEHTHRTYSPKYLVNNNITVERMPFTTSGDDSTYTGEYLDNTTDVDETSFSLKSEKDFNSLVSELSLGNGEELTNYANGDYISENLDNDTDKPCNCDTVSCLCETANFMITEDSENVINISSKQCKSSLLPKPQKSTDSKDHLNNNKVCFPKSQELLEYYQSTEIRKDEVTGGNKHTVHEGFVTNIERLCHAYSDVVHVNDDAVQSAGISREEKENVNCHLYNHASLSRGCAGLETNSSLHESEKREISEDGSIPKTHFSIGNECIFDQDNVPEGDAIQKKLFINNWAQGFPQAGYNAEMFASEASNVESYLLFRQTSINSAEDATLEGSNCSRSTSPDLSESTWSISSLNEMPQGNRRLSCCSIASLSSLSIADFLLRPHSASTTANVSLPQSRRASIDGTVDKVSSRQPLLSCSKSSRRASVTSATFEGLSNLSRRSSFSVVISRPTSPIIEETHLGVSRNLSLSTLTEISSKSSVSQCSRKSSLIDSNSTSPSRKSSYPERRSSDSSEISLMSLHGTFTERGSLFSNSLDPLDSIERNDTPSPSPFGDQLKYFQDKRKNQMFLVKTTTTRLGLNTRRNSYNLWREENLDNRGRPLLKKPEINVGEKTDIFTKERVAAINMAMEWVREELHQLREQDESLAHQFLDIRRTIHELKLDWSCEDHREMLMQAEDEIDTIENLKRVSDLPEHHSHDFILRNKGVTRIKLGERKYSIF